MKKEIKIWVGSGLFCVLLLLASVWYAVAYNDSRLVEPMDFSSYVFQTKDLPMLLSGALIALYAVALAAALLRRALKARRRGGETSTRRLNPKLGLLGLLGFLGFGGFWTYGVDGTVFPFAFFLFFGFFCPIPSFSTTFHTYSTDLSTDLPHIDTLTPIWYI